MDERVVKFRVGVIVLATMIILAILVLLFNDFGSFLRGSYTLYIHFSEAPGVAADTPVRKDGILIGKVTRVRFADDDPKFQTQGGVVVTVGINADRRIHTNEHCRISGTILGDAVLQFVPGGSHPSNDFLKNGDYLEGSVTANPLQILTNLEGNIGGAITSMGTASNDIGRLARRLDSFFENNDDQLNRIVNKTEKALDSFDKTMKSINVLLGDDALGGPAGDDSALALGGGKEPGVVGVPGVPGPADLPEQVRKRVVTMPQLMAETRDAIIEMRGAVETANRTMGNLERFTGPLGERGEDIVNKVDRSVGHLDDLLRQFVTFGETLNKSEGTIGLLVRNPELYQHLNAAACNIEQLIKQLRPIIADARVFSDKIARHPEVLIRGILKPSSGIK